MTLENFLRLSAALAQAQSAIDAAAERELQRRAGQITTLSSGSMTPSPEQCQSIHQAAAAELQERFAEQVESLVGAFRAALSQPYCLARALRGAPTPRPAFHPCSSWREPF